MKAQTYLFTLFLLILLGNTSIAEVLKVRGTVNGVVNKAILEATTTGELDTVEGFGKVTITIRQLPPNFDPRVLSFSLLSICCSCALKPLDDALNLFQLTKGNYQAERKMLYPNFPNGSFTIKGNVSLLQEVLGCAVEISGNWDGPIDLVKVTDYKLHWKSGIKDTLEEYGTSTITRIGGKSFGAIWNTTYSKGGLVLPAPEEATITYTKQTFDGVILALEWNGRVQLARRPGPRAVNAQKKLATTWGELKSNY